MAEFAEIGEDVGAGKEAAAGEEDSKGQSGGGGISESGGPIEQGIGFAVNTGESIAQLAENDKRAKQSKEDIRLHELSRGIINKDNLDPRIKPFLWNEDSKGHRGPRGAGWMQQVRDKYSELEMIPIQYSDASIKQDLREGRLPPGWSLALLASQGYASNAMPLVQKIQGHKDLEIQNSREKVAEWGRNIKQAQRSLDADLYRDSMKRLLRMPPVVMIRSFNLKVS